MGKVALVTGGANGIGAAIVARLAKEGAKVLVADRTKPAAVSDSIRYIQTDATKGEDAAVAITTALEMWGRLDILVNNAGVGAYGETPDMDEKLWDQVFAINIRAIFLFCHAAIPAMLENGGAIVNIASISGLFGDFGMGAYNASKGAVVNYTRSLALECSRHDIRVNALCPGLVDTAMSAGGLERPEDRADWIDRIPLGRLARPEEMAAVVAFLASNDASYMTGSIVTADGGITSHTGQPNIIARRKRRETSTD
jgi:meso-butanediol dehydrogenase/(S,S)-butanediol dehydrogenase/diacetyl reductase